MNKTFILVLMAGLVPDAKAQTIYVPSCDSLVKEHKQDYCLNKGGHLSSTFEVKLTNDEGQEVDTGKMDYSRETKNDLYKFLSTKGITTESLHLKACSDTNPDPYCVRRKKIAKTEFAQNADGGSYRTYHVLTRAELVKDFKNLGVIFTTSPTPTPTTAPTATPTATPSLEEVTKEAEKNIPSKSLMLKGSDANQCASSAAKLLVSGKGVDQKAAAKFIALQTELTTNRLYYAFLTAKLTAKHPESVRTEAVIRALYFKKTAPEFVKMAERFDDADGKKTVGMIKAVSLVSNIIDQQGKNGTDAILAIGESDMRLLSWYDESNGDGKHALLSFAAEVDQAIAKKDLNPEAIRKKQKALLAREVEINKALNKLASDALTSSADCELVQDCDASQGKIRAEVQKMLEVNKALYSTLKLRKRDLAKGFVVHGSTSQENTATGASTNAAANSSGNSSNNAGSSNSSNSGTATVANTNTGSHTKSSTNSSRASNRTTATVTQPGTSSFPARSSSVINIGNLNVVKAIDLRSLPSVKPRESVSNFVKRYLDFNTSLEPGLMFGCCRVGRGSGKVTFQNASNSAWAGTYDGDKDASSQASIVKGIQNGCSCAAGTAADTESFADRMTRSVSQLHKRENNESSDTLQHAGFTWGVCEVTLQPASGTTRPVKVVRNGQTILDSNVDLGDYITRGDLDSYKELKNKGDYLNVTAYLARACK